MALGPFIAPVLICLVLWFDYLIAKEFYIAAQGKGYSQKKYFWICFFLGIIGYLLVIALPSCTNAEDTISPIINKD